MKSWIGKVLIFVAGIASGGLAGAIYTHHVNRPEPTSVAASTSTITIANPQSAGSLIPDLKVQVGNEVIGSLYAQTVTLDVISGPYVEAADVAISFPNAPHIYGAPVTSVPSPLHSIVCTAIANGFRCRISPLKVNSGGPFRVSIATDKPEQPRVDIVAKDVQLATASELAVQNAHWPGEWLLAFSSLVSGVCAALAFAVFRSVSRRLATDLIILEAQYGCEGHRLDVARQLNDLIEDGKLHVYVGNQLAGDPCPNTSKNLILKYKYKEQRLEATVNEGATLDLP
jgi:hypothetical protein